MTCLPLVDHKNRRTGILCVGREPVKVGRYQFEWTAACGWMPVNKDGSERLAPVPDHIWDEVAKLPTPEQLQHEAERYADKTIGLVSLHSPEFREAFWRRMVKRMPPEFREASLHAPLAIAKAKQEDVNDA